MGVLIIRALPFGVHIRAPDSWKLAHLYGKEYDSIPDHSIPDQTSGQPKLEPSSLFRYQAEEFLRSLCSFIKGAAAATQKLVPVRSRAW